MKYWYLGLLLALAGCMVIDQETATQGKTKLVGKSRSEILACAGVPNATFRNGPTEYFAYGASGRAHSGGSAMYLGNGMFTTHGSSRQAQCVVTIAFQGNRVAAVNYRSSGGAIIAPDEACGSVVRGCLR